MSGQQQRSLLGTTARIAVLKGFSGLASAGVIIVTARDLGPRGRGVFVLLFTLATFAMIVCSLGTNISARIQLPAADAQVDAGDYFGLVAALTALQTTVCVVAGAAVLPLFDVRLDPQTLVAFAALGAAMFAAFMILEALNAYGHTVAFAFIDTLGSLVQLALVGALAAGDVSKVKPFVWAVASSFALQAVMGAFELARRGVGVRPRLRLTRWRLLLQHGPSAMAVQLGQQSVFRFDRYLIALFLTPAAVGVYSVAAAFPEMLRVLPVAMALPVFYGSASGTASIDEFVRTRRLCLIVMAAAGLVTIAAAPLAVRVLFGDAYAGAVGPLRLLIVAEVVLAVYYIDGAALTGQARVRETAAAVVVGVTVGVFAYLALIAPLGINGAALGSVLAYAAMAFVASQRLRREISPGSPAG